MDKPTCDIIGANSNIFNLAAIASRSLRKAGLQDQILELRDRVLASATRAAAVRIIMEYV